MSSYSEGLRRARDATDSAEMYQRLSDFFSSQGLPAEVCYQLALAAIEGARGQIAYGYHLYQTGLTKGENQ